MVALCRLVPPRLGRHKGTPPPGTRTSHRLRHKLLAQSSPPSWHKLLAQSSPPSLAQAWHTALSLSPSLSISPVYFVDWKLEMWSVGTRVCEARGSVQGRGTKRHKLAQSGTKWHFAAQGGTSACVRGCVGDPNSRSCTSSVLHTRHKARHKANPAQRSAGYTMGDRRKTAQSGTSAQGWH